MKILVVLLALAVVSRAQDEELDIDAAVVAVFDALLAEDGIDMTDEAYEYRLVQFDLNYGELAEGVKATLELMMTDEELNKQNGAKMVPGLKSTIQKREEEYLRTVRTPPVYDGRSLIGPAVNQETCGNCYLHTFVAALEVAYAKSTGEMLKFSEQEMTDCYDNGCEGGDFRMVAIQVALLDKLSLRSTYGKYMDGQYTCKSGQTPDALSKIKVVDFVTVTPDTIEAALVQYGSVMTCMEWGGMASERCYMSTYQAGTVVDYPEVVGGCAHAVLIMGYTPDHYIVRNSHGTGWGEDGYFRIKRGTNSCGIEELMAAVKVEVRTDAKAVRPNGCPSSQPKLCRETNMCVKGPEACQSTLNAVELEALAKREVEEEEARVPGMRKKRDEEKRIPGMQEERVKREEEEDEEALSDNIGKREEDKRRNRKGGFDPADFIPGKLLRNLKARGVAEEDLAAYFKREEDVELEERAPCRDNSGGCAKKKAQGQCRKKQYQTHCAKTCGKCGAVKPKPPPMSKEDMGKCVIPNLGGNIRIKNGAAGTTIAPNTELQVVCRPGMTLVGGASKCLFQNVFTNDIKDSRLMPECITTGGESFTGSGADYIGTASTFTDAMGQTVTCDDWSADILRGKRINDKEAGLLAIGNHNLCRNPGGMEPVPFCLSPGSAGAEVKYCFKFPACDVCAGAADEYDAGFCGGKKNGGGCEYTDVKTKDRVSFAWNVCKASCCAAAGC